MKKAKFLFFICSLALISCSHSSSISSSSSSVSSSSNPSFSFQDTSTNDSLTDSSLSSESSENESSPFSDQTTSEIESVHDSISKLKVLLSEEEEKKEDYKGKNQIMEDDLYSEFMKVIKEDNAYNNKR